MKNKLSIQAKVQEFLENKHFLYVSISVLFALIWVGTFVNLDFHIGEITLLIYVLLPIVLLVTAIQYQSSIAYYAVISLVVLSILVRIELIISLYSSYIKYGEDLEFICSCDPIGDVIGYLMTFCISFIVLGLMHNKTLTSIYKWTLPKFLIAIAFGCLLFLLNRI